MTEEEIKALAQESAHAAVHQTFRMFGVDTNEQESVNEFRHDLVFARELRKTTKGVKSKALMLVVTMAIGAMLAAIAKGFGVNPK